MGHQQSAWLGDYLRAQGTEFDRVVCGNLRRHQETVAGLGLSQSIEIDHRVNELRYFDLAQEYQAQTRKPLPSSAEEFAQHVPQLFTAWHAGRLDNAHESYRSFADRFGQVMSELTELGGRSLVVTSGGVIGMAIARHLSLGPEGFAQVMLPIHNSSIHRFSIAQGVTQMASYNGTPHLDASDRRHARTVI
jgi:broad specificity phosphatase PhoE